VAVLDDYLHRADTFADWESLGPDVTVTFFHDPMGEEELASHLADADVLVLMRERSRFPRSLLQRLPNLRLVVTTGMRNASLDVDYLHERGVTFCGTGYAGQRGPGVSGTVEVAWALILSAVKRVGIEDRALRAGRWQTGFPGELAGATLGLIGLGNLGSQMVGPARAFGMDVIAWSTNLTPEAAAQAGATYVTKDELFGRADVLTIHLVLSGRSRGLVGAAELGLMKATALLVNTSRGPIVDEAALIDALRSHRLAGVGLDVFDTEPLPADHPLRFMDGVVATPHIGYVADRVYRTFYGEAAAEIGRWLDAG